MRVKRTYRARATELVRQLGYHDIEKSEDRPYEALKKATCDFRKNYQLKQLAGVSFPLDPKDPRVTECVVSFLDAHSELFKASKEAIDHGWPIITVAEDKAK
jgi:FAD/FMN-containing dehydrogenase